MKSIKAILAIGLAMISSVAAAEAYIGIGAGITHSNAAKSLQQVFNYSSVQKEESSNAAFNIYGGYAFTKNYALEADYIDFGTYKNEGTLAGYSRSDSLSAKAYSLALVGSYPFNDSFSADVKIGAALVSQKYRCTDPNFCWQLEDTNQTNPVVVAGLGAHWFVTQHFAVRMAYEHFSGAKYEVKDIYGEVRKDNVDYGLLYAGAEVRF